MTSRPSRAIAAALIVGALLGGLIATTPASAASSTGQTAVAPSTNPHLGTATPPKSSKVTTKFLPHSTAQAWLDKQTVAEVAPAAIVFSHSKTLNCGYAAIPSGVNKSRYAAGCYNPKYGATVFIWWGKRSTVKQREFVLLHEYSHFRQWNDHYATMLSLASDTKHVSTKQWRQIVEADATCRVLHQWHYSQFASQARASSSPCTVKHWRSSYLEDRARALHVVMLTP